MARNSVITQRENSSVAWHQIYVNIPLDLTLEGKWFLQVIDEEKFFLYSQLIICDPCAKSEYF